MDSRHATREEVGLMLDWAAEEGWNPGVDDASAFYATDPDGFFVATDQDTPVAAISVIRQGETNQGDPYGFLGLYISKPAYRGHGYGWKVWQAGMDYLGGHTVALDGVIQQQANYKKSGFDLAYRNVRFTGSAIDILNSPEVDHETDLATRATDDADIDALIQMDAAVGGVNRSRYLANWLKNTDSRTTFIAESSTGENKLAGFGTIRCCREQFKIGPLLAQNASTAISLMHKMIALVKADVVTLDVPEPNKAAMDMAATLGLKPVFETARMYRGTRPVSDLSRLFGVATLELG